MPAQDLWDTVQKLAPLSPVRYEFRLHGWKGAPWHVLRLELVEALNLPYRLTLELVVDEPRIDLDDLLGDSCTCEIDRDGGDARSVHGLVFSADDLGRVAGRHHIRLEIGPALALLAQSVDTRAWQDAAAPDVVRDVLSPELARDNRSVDIAALALADYPRRDYCVQFRESNLAFISRLLEEEGITYHFNFDGPSERLVLTDDNRDFAPLQPAPLELIETEPDTAPSESLQRFTWGRRLRSTSVDQRNFDWQSPDAPRTAARPGADLRGRTREVYEHDDIIYPGDGPRHARLKQERLSLGGHVASGASNVARLAPGLWFALQGHARGELDDKYLVTRVVHRGHSPDAAIFLQQLSSAPRYTNEFECVPLHEPHRPALLHTKPRVSGLQTAIVTGPPGEEVHCDEHGRIKILPHWDRLSPRDDTSSWWVRVTQAFAGPGWGSFFLPRIGMEVVIDFLDGDPDRPLVVGCVYNGSNSTPYPLPAEKTKTTIKSNSSPGGGGSNELRFEDQAGAEEVFLHAQKDWNSVVNNNRSLSIGANETNSVGANRTRTVGMNETVTIGMNETLTVGMNITQTCGMNLTRTVGANETVKITKNQDETIDENQSLTVKGSRSKSVTGAESASVGGARTHSVGEFEQISITGPQLVTIGDNQVIAVTKNQATTVTENHGLSVTLASKEDIGQGKSLSVGEFYKVTAKAMSTTVTEAYLETTGTLRTINAGTAIELSCGAAKIVLETGGKITISGTSFEFSASGSVKINGSIIDLN
jgi:type VI secretion system secreted protein VgrG